MDTFAVRRIRLKHLVDSIANGNVSVFAGRFGYSAAQISQYLSSTYNGGRSMGERAARALEAKVSIPPGWLDQPIEPINSDHSRAAYAAADALADAPGGRPLMLRSVPIRWQATTTSDGLIEMKKTGDEPQYVDFATYSPDAFAIRIKGHDLKPRIRSGEVIVVEPSRKPEPGDDVLVHLQSDEHMVMQYLYTRDEEWLFGPINEDGPNASCADSEIVDVSVITAGLRQSALDIPSQKT